MTRRTLADYLESGDCPETDDELYDLLDEAADAAESACQSAVRQAEQDEYNAYIADGGMFA